MRLLIQSINGLAVLRFLSGATARAGVQGTVLLAILSIAGCQTPVKPWQKQNLAQPGMQFDVNDQDLIMDMHFYYSKEGTSGGTGVSAGGCGCN